VAQIGQQQSLNQYSAELKHSGHNMLKIITVILLSAWSLPSYLCVIPPPETYDHIDNLIDRTSTIVLAQVSNAEALKITRESRLASLSEPEMKEFLDELTDEEKAIVIERHTTGIAYRPLIEYTFIVLEILKGSIEESFTIEGYMLSQSDFGDFENHTAERFWDGSGRLYTRVDCQIHPSFNTGGIYLLFLDKPYHGKGMEEITNIGKDKWFSYVKSKIGP